MEGGDACIQVLVHEAGKVLRQVGRGEVVFGLRIADAVHGKVGRQQTRGPTHNQISRESNRCRDMHTPSVELYSSGLFMRLE